MSEAGKTVIVTGSSGGIGRVIALRFARDGWNVVVNGRNPERAESVAREVAAAGGKAVAVAADLTRENEAEHLVDAAVAAWGRVDVLVNNAGAVAPKRPLEEITGEEWDRVLAANLKTVFFGSRAAASRMRPQGSGRIINISSQAGRALSILAGPHYAAAKAGIIALTKYLAHELAPEGIRVNAVAPGVVECGEDFTRIWEGFSAERRERVIADIPARRLGRPEDVAEAVLFLASEGSDYFVGATLDLNGGRWMI